MRLFIKNPFSFWVNGLVRQLIFRISNRKKKVCIRYLARVSSGCTLGCHTVVYDRAILYNVKLGDFSYVGRDSRISRAEIGKFCCLGPEVLIGLGKHPSDTLVSIHPIFYSPLKQVGVTFADYSYFEEFGRVKIGNDVWIGARSIILDDVIIGDGAIIAAGSVVTKDVPDYAIVGGVPAKMIKHRFLPREIKILKKAKWWDKDISWLSANYKKFHNIDKFSSELKLDSGSELD